MSYKKRKTRGQEASGREPGRRDRGAFHEHKKRHTGYSEEDRREYPVREGRRTDRKGEGRAHAEAHTKGNGGRSAEELSRQEKVVMDLVMHPDFHPMKIKDIAIILGVPKERRGELEEILNRLIAKGKIGLSKRGKYGKPENTALVGTFSATAKGFGFVTVEGKEQDYYVNEAYTGGAFHGDTVKIAVTSEGGDGRRPEARVLEVLERNLTEVVGLYKKNTNFGFVIPDNGRFNTDVFIPAGKDKGAVSGHKVVVHLDSYGDEHKNPEGTITEILGHVNDPGVDITSVIRAYGIPDEFPEEVMQQAAGTPEAINGDDYPERRDLRTMQMVTIDGEDAKDLDDAVSLTETDKGYLLGVHIADVSEYVTENSPLDKEALNRGTSTYVTDRVVPMLPHRLSNGICSLNAGCDRLALSCLMEIGRDGQVTGHEITESVIRVNRRMSYTVVNRLLNSVNKAAAALGITPAEAAKQAEAEKLTAEECGLTVEEMAELTDHKDLIVMFENMKKLADQLRARRRARGSVDFDLPESKIILDEKGRPIAIKSYERNQATDLIEDFMLMANETVAEDYYWQNLPFLYRIHEKPDEEKVQELAVLLRSMGARLQNHKGEIRPMDLQRMLASMAERPEYDFISRLALRSMKQAKYSQEHSGHFGLAAEYYTHFTSPIRRYPDLQIHRIIKENLRGKLDEKRQEHYARILPEVAAWSSKAERRSTEAERTVNKMKMAQYMRSHIGEVYPGMITGVTRWGIYVQLPNTVEGLVRMQNLTDDFYIYNEKAYAITGERTGRSYHLGQRVMVEVIQVDTGLSAIDFAIADDAEV